MKFLSLIFSLESNFKFLTRKYDDKGKNKIIKIEIINQIFFQLIVVKRKIINTGRINSAADNPNQPVLKALPLDLVKYLEIVVVAV